MRKLYFISNEDQAASEKELALFVTPFLQAYGDVPDESAKAIEIIPDVYQMDQDKLCHLCFDPRNAILAFSAYSIVPDRSNSKAQLFGLLRTAGTSDVYEAMYVDMGDHLLKTLRGMIYDQPTKVSWEVLAAIERNYIITQQDAAFHRVRVNLSNRDIFVLEPADLVHLVIGAPPIPSSTYEAFKSQRQRNAT